MKKLLLLTILLTFILFGCGQTKPESEFTIRLSGTTGMSVKGAYMLTTHAGTSTSKSDEITLPYELKIKGNLISVSYRKNIMEGQLDLELLKDGEVVSNTGTSEPYGLVVGNTKL